MTVVTFTRRTTEPFAGAEGPGAFVYEPGDIVDFPEAAAQMHVANGNAKLGGKVAKPAPKAKS